MVISDAEKNEAVRLIRAQLAEWRRKHGLPPKPSEERT